MSGSRSMTTVLGAHGSGGAVGENGEGTRRLPATGRTLADAPPRPDLPSPERGGYRCAVIAAPPSDSAKKSVRSVNRWSRVRPP